MSNKKTVWSTVAGILSSVLAFLGIVSCCGMPILASIFRKKLVAAIIAAIFLTAVISGYLFNMLL